MVRGMDRTALLTLHSINATGWLIAGVTVYSLQGENPAGPWMIGAALVAKLAIWWFWLAVNANKAGGLTAQSFRDKS